VHLRSTALFDYPTILDLARHLLAQLDVAVRDAV
jgi:hypothetical protein